MLQPTVQTKEQKKGQIVRQMSVLRATRLVVVSRYRYIYVHYHIVWRVHAYIVECVRVYIDWWVFPRLSARLYYFIIPILPHKEQNRLLTCDVLQPGHWTRDCPYKSRPVARLPLNHTQPHAPPYEVGSLTFFGDDLCILCLVVSACCALF